MPLLRTKQLACAAAALACAVACGPKSASPTVAPPATPAPAPGPQTTAAAEEFPPGAGRQILTNSCTSCHDLREVSKFRGFYVRAQWRDIVMTMVDYGAPVSEKEIEVLTDYLTRELGKK